MLLLLMLLLLFLMLLLLLLIVTRVDFMFCCCAAGFDAVKRYISLMQAIKVSGNLFLWYIVVHYDTILLNL